MGLRVEPIRDREKIAEIKSLLRADGNIRDLLLFTAGINFALRAGDLLDLRVKHFFNNGEIRNFFDIIEKKTGKKNRIYITDSVRSILRDYVLKYDFIFTNNENYIFFNSKAKGQTNYTVKWAGLIIKKLARKVGIAEDISSHSLRKTWAYQARQKGVDLITIQNKLNHSKLETTEKYLGFKNEEIEKACLDLNL